MTWNSSRNLLSGIVMGAVAGAAVGYLTAPRSGARTRKMIMKNVDQSRARLAIAVNEAGSRVTDVIQDAREQVNSMVDDTVRQAQSRVHMVGRNGKRRFDKEIQAFKGGIYKARKSIIS